MSNHPPCFATSERHSEWLSLARVSQEFCSICDDCTQEHELEMILQGKCYREYWATMKVNRRESSGSTREPSCESLEQRERLERVREAAGIRARAYLAGDTGSVQEGGEL